MNTKKDLKKKKRILNVEEMFKIRGGTDTSKDIIPK